jgi:hypothetical protein
VCSQGPHRQIRDRYKQLSGWAVDNQARADHRCQVARVSIVAGPGYQEPFVVALPRDLPGRRATIRRENVTRLRCFAPRLAVVPASKARYGYHHCLCRRLWPDCPSVRSVLVQRVMQTVPMDSSRNHASAEPDAVRSARSRGPGSHGGNCQSSVPRFHSARVRG